MDHSGNVYIADTGDNSIREVTPDGIINTVAGDGYPQLTAATRGLAAWARLCTSPEDVAVDSSGNIYIADTGNGVIRKVTTDGNINYHRRQRAAIGVPPAIGRRRRTSAGLIAPFALAVDSSGNVYFAENGDSRIRKVDTKGNINTIAGNGTAGFRRRRRGATKAQLNCPDRAWRWIPRAMSTSPIR